MCVWVGVFVYYFQLLYHGIKATQLLIAIKLNVWLCQLYMHYCNLRGIKRFISHNYSFRFLTRPVPWNKTLCQNCRFSLILEATTLLFLSPKYVKNIGMHSTGQYSNTIWHACICSFMPLLHSITMSVCSWALPEVYTCISDIPTWYKWCPSIHMYLYHMQNDPI